MAPSKNRRKAVSLVDKDRQVQIFLNIFGPPVVVLALTSFMFAFFSRRLTHEALAAGAQLPSLGWMIGSAALFLLAATGLIGIQALRVSQRIVGPMFSIRRTFREFLDGDRTKRVQLRREDYLAELVEELNELLRWAEESERDATDESDPADGTDVPMSSAPDATSDEA